MLALIRLTLTLALTLSIAAGAVDAANKGAARKASRKATPNPNGAADVEHLITVEGSIPDSVAGNWLVIRHAKVSNQAINGLELFRITRKDDTWHFLQVYGTFPSGLTSALNAANEKDGMLVPTPEDLKAVAAAAPSFKPTTGPDRPKTVWLRTPEFFTKSPDPDPRSKGAKFGLELLMASKEGVVAAGTSFFVKDVAEDKMSGDFAGAAVAIQAEAVGALLPVVIDGSFVMYRLPTN